MAESLAHSLYPKVWRKLIYNQHRADIQQNIRDLCKLKGVEIIEGHMMPDHIHLLLSIPQKMSILSFMGYLKGKSAMMIFDKYSNLKYKFGNRNFWATGYYVNTVGLVQATPFRGVLTEFFLLSKRLKKAKKYTDLTELTHEILHMFIEKIGVDKKADSCNCPPFCPIIHVGLYMQLFISQ